MTLTDYWYAFMYGLGAGFTLGIVLTLCLVPEREDEEEKE